MAISSDAYIGEAAELIQDDAARAVFVDAFSKSFYKLNGVEAGRAEYFLDLLSQAQVFFANNDFDKNLKAFGTNLGNFMGLIKFVKLSLLLEPAYVVFIFNKIYLHNAEGRRPYAHYIRKGILDWINNVGAIESRLLPEQKANFEKIVHQIHL